MSHPLITDCPVCAQKLTVTQLKCSHCQTTIENSFELSRLASLNKDQLHFVETFLICRGNIKEVEKELGISYPTVRGKLNDIVQALGLPDPELPNKATEEKDIINQLENGDITADEALKLLKKL